MLFTSSQTNFTSRAHTQPHVFGGEFGEQQVHSTAHKHLQRAAFNLTVHNKQRFDTSRILGSGATTDWDIYALNTLNNPNDPAVSPNWGRSLHSRFLGFDDTSCKDVSLPPLLLHTNLHNHLHLRPEGLLCVCVSTSVPKRHTSLSHRKKQAGDLFYIKRGDFWHLKGELGDLRTVKPLEP